MDFSQMSDEELLKPDAKDSTRDFSHISDDELLKPDAQASTLDFSQMSDEELLRPDAHPSGESAAPAVEPPKKKDELGFWERERLELEAKTGEKTSWGDLALNKTVGFGIDEAAEANDEWRETQLMNGKVDDPADMWEMARMINIPAEDLAPALERAYIGKENFNDFINRIKDIDATPAGMGSEQTPFILKQNFKDTIDPSVMKTSLAEIAKARLADRIRTREAAQSRLQGAEEQSGWGKFFSGLVDMPSMVLKFIHPAAIVLSTGVNARNRTARMETDTYTLDADGNPVVTKKGEEPGMAFLKGTGGAVAETFIWTKLGAILKPLKGLILKIPGVDRLAAKAVKGNAGVGEKIVDKLGQSESGRLAMKTVAVLGSVEEQVHLGSLPNMIMKSRLTEFCDEVVGLNARPGEREAFGEWLDKVTSAGNNADMLLGLLGMHAASIGFSAAKAHGANKRFRHGVKGKEGAPNREGFVAQYIGREAAKKLSNKDLDVMNKILGSGRITPDNVNALLNKIAADRAEAKARMESGQTLAEVMKAWRDSRSVSQGLQEGVERLAEMTKRRAKPGADQEHFLDETIKEFVGEDLDAQRKVKERVLANLTDARELDDPQLREAHVMLAAKDVESGRDGHVEDAGTARSVGEEPQVAASKPLELFKQLDEGKLPVEDVAVGGVEPLAPTENGNVIASYDPAKAKPIVVWEDLEGNRHAVTGGKRISMATASGAETVKAVVVREADGWSEAEARGLGATENLREGHGGIKNVVEAVDSLGADQVAELAGWHQANGSREFASTIRKGLAVAQKGGTELKAALAEGRIEEDFAYNVAQVLSMERVGEGWEAAQRELAALIGKVGPEEMDAVLWGLKRRLDAGEINDFAAAIAEERAKYNEKKGGKSGQLDSDAILMETEDGDLKTLGEMEAEQGNGELGTGNVELETGNGVAPELAAAEGAGQNKAVALQPVAEKPGTFATLSHPNARFTVDGEKKVVHVEGLAEADFAAGNAEKTAALVARVEAYARENGLSIGFNDDAVMEAWRAAREQIKAEAAERFAAKDREARRVTVVDQLKKSGLAEGVIETAEDFNRMFEEMSGEALRAGEEVYGFVDPKTKKIYLNPEFFATGQGLEAPIHEFGHLGVIAAEKVNKAVYDRGMKLATDFLEKPESAGTGAIRELVDLITNDRVYSAQGRKVQAEELLAQLIGKRGAEALKAETNASVVAKVKSWLVEFWNTFGKALGLKDITPEQAENMTLEDVADAIRAEMFSGRKYGEELDRVEFTNGGAHVVTKPVRIRKKLAGRRKAVNEFVNRMGGADDPANTETDLLALWVDNGGRLFDRMPFEVETSYSKGATGVKKTRRAVADEFAESTAFYRDLDPAQRKVFFGSEKLETGPIGEGLKNALEAAGITRFTNEDGTVDYEAVIGEFKRQWTNYERGEEVLKERNAWQEERDRAFVEEMERAEQAAYDEMSAEEAAARAEMEAADEASAAQIAADLAAGRFSRGGIFTGTAADYANRSRQGGKDDGPSLKKIGTGEGSQVYGWGLYGSTVRGVAEQYARIATGEMITLRRNGTKIGNVDIKTPQGFAENAFMRFNGDVARAVEDLKKQEKQYRRAAAKGNRFANDAKLCKEAAEYLVQHGSEYEISEAPGSVYEQTFFTNRAPGDESHLLKWYEPVGEEQRKWIANELVKEGWQRTRDTVRTVYGQEYDSYHKGENEKDYENKIHLFKGAKASELYRDLSELLGTPQAASEFLARAGIDGVKYPVDSYGGKGVKNGDEVGWNYVSFRDDNIRVDHKWTDGQMRFSRFAGEKGAENMGVGNANHARSMESAGADREKIWRETGWWKGKDGKWRFELPNVERFKPVKMRLVDGAESKTILERLGDKAKGLGISGLQSPSETKAHRNPENGRSGLQSPSRSISQGTLHSIADAGSPVKGGIVSQTATRQFKNWFGGSQVVDENGEPLVVYHGTEKTFWSFSNQQIGSHTDAGHEGGVGLWGRGHYFTSNRSVAEGYARGNPDGRTMAVYLNIRNPMGREELVRIGAEAARITEDRPEDFYREYQRLIDESVRKNGYDGAIVNNKYSTEYVVFEPNQIKSATDNIGTFDPGNNDIRFSRAPEAKLVRTTRVADDAGQGEQTPGAIAASAELSRQGAVPLTTKGSRYVSLPLSEMNALARYLTGHALPGEMQSGRKLGAAGKASARQRKIVIAADVLGTIDKSDMAVEKEFLRQHGFFRHENANWCATHSPSEVRQERERSDAALSSRLEALSDRRTHGKEPGGMAAARRVYADQLAKIVMAMPHGQPGVLGAMQTVAGALEKRVRGSEAEAEAFLDWMSGQPQASGRAPRSAQERKAEMFAAFLMMPKEMEARAKGWYDAMRSTIAGDKKLTAAFREMTVRMMTEQGFGHLQAEIEKDISRQHEQAVAKLNREADESIKPKSRRAQIKEAVVLTFDDKGGAALVRIGERERMYLGAQRKLLEQAKTPQERALIKQQIDAYLGDMGQKLNTLALARAAWERGSGNADSVYGMKLCDALNEALVRDGLRFIDLSLYLDQQRVIETKGISGSRGESARQAQFVLDAMKKRLGADFAKVEAFARKFHAIHEQEFLNSPALERVLGKRTLDAWRENIHYVTTKRQFSPEELKEIEAKRAELRKTGAFGGDDMVGDVYKYATRLDPTAGLRGSFASKREVMSATMEKTGAIMHWARKCNYVIELRDALLAAGVEGVHDMPAGTNELKSRKRYGTISYVENGQKRTLVVPKEIVKDFEQTDSYDNAAIRLLASCNNFARRMVIDYNLPYGLSNMWRNVGSAESNVPGMREAVIKRASRFVSPGVATAEEIAMQLLVRNLPEKWSLPLRKMWGEHTALYWLPQAKRIAMWLTDYNKMQRKFWEAEQRRDLGTLQQMEEDRRWAIMAKRANMFHSMTTGRIADPSMLDAQMQRSSMTLMSSELREMDAKPMWRRALDFVNIFQRNARQQVYEDVLIKTIVFLHDRAQFGKTHNRTLEESGLIARKYAGIPETERKGIATPGIQAVFNPFWGAIEKGVMRHVDAIRERPKETLQKDAWRLSARITNGLLASGALAAYILYLNDGDEEKAKNGKLGAVYSYARGYQRAYQNCSNYVRNNYHITPLWTKGYTSIILGMPLTDEERILEPVASLISDAAAVAAGTKQSLHMQEHLLNLTKVIAPDFKMAGFGVTLFDDTLGTFLYEPKDYYTGGYKYDRDLYATRYESLRDFGQFSWAMAKRLWNDFGGRGILPTDRSGVDNGLGEEPGWVARAVNSIPIASPYARRMVKVQVGSPRRDAAEILEAERIRQAVIRKSARRMFKIAHDEKRDLSLDSVRYGEMLDKWQKAYGLTPDEMAQIEGRYLNAWRAYEGAQYRADGEREKFRTKAEKLGLDAANLWLDFD